MMKGITEGYKKRNVPGTIIHGTAISLSFLFFILHLASLLYTEWPLEQLGKTIMWALTLTASSILLHGFVQDTKRVVAIVLYMVSMTLAALSADMSGLGAVSVVLNGLLAIGTALEPHSSICRQVLSPWTFCPNDVELPPYQP